VARGANAAALIGAHHRGTIASGRERALLLLVGRVDQNDGGEAIALPIIAAVLRAATAPTTAISSEEFLSEATRKEKELSLTGCGLSTLNINPCTII
jgi:hypothetical protein